MRECDTDLLKALNGSVDRVAVGVWKRLVPGAKLVGGFNFGHGAPPRIVAGGGP